jgi:hypothetical protein
MNRIDQKKSAGSNFGTSIKRPMHPSPERARQRH